MNIEFKWNIGDIVTHRGVEALGTDKESFSGFRGSNEHRLVIIGRATEECAGGRIQKHYTVRVVSNKSGIHKERWSFHEEELVDLQTKEAMK